MTRPLRFEEPGALYHITARGERRQSIFRSDSDRLVWLTLLGEACARFQFVVHAYCQMGNHYHVVLTTTQGRLAQGMRYLNGNYSQYFNRTHKLVGHVFQGRYKAILCQRATYLMELARYVVLNPVRAGMVSHPVLWPWSSYRATSGLEDAPAWLSVDEILALWDSRRLVAEARYEQFVLQGIGAESPLKHVTCQLLLGDETFCQRLARTPVAGDLIEIRRQQRQAVLPPLADFFAGRHNPQLAMAQAYLSLGYSMGEIARYRGVSVKTVSRAVKLHEKTAGRLEPDQRS